VKLASLPSLLFDPRGRVGRLPYIFVQIIVIALDYWLRSLIKATPAAMFMSERPGGASTQLAIYEWAGMAIFYVSFAISLKRLRDMGQNVWWLALIYGPGLALIVILKLALIHPVLLMSLAALMPSGFEMSLLLLGIYVTMYGFKLWLATAPAWDRSLKTAHALLEAQIGAAPDARAAAWRPPAHLARASASAMGGAVRSSAEATAGRFGRRGQR
jgi:uncharacterized membrane protein YhaH (DUF805 family)